MKHHLTTHQITLGWLMFCTLLAVALTLGGHP